MSKRYVATIMKRHNLGRDTYFFIPDHAVLGHLDEKVHEFIDLKGNVYPSMEDDNALLFNEEYTYHFAISVDALEKHFENNVSLIEMVNEYENINSGFCFYAAIKDNGKPFWIMIPEKELYEQTLENTSISMYGLPEDEEIYYDIEALNKTASELVLGITNGTYNKEDLKKLREVFMLESDQELGKELQYIFGENLEEAASQLIMEIITGKYSERELEQMKNFLNHNIESLDDVINTILLQTESLKKDIEDLEEKDKLRKERELKLQQRKIKEEKEKKKKINIEELFKNVTKTLIAQDEPTKRVITEIARKEMDSRKKKEGILLTGPTGVGKTEMMRLIAKYLDRPFIKIDATQLTSPGYVGRDIEEALWELYVKCGENKEEAEKAIVFFDEVDKKGSAKKDDPSGKGVLNTLLPFIEGTTYDACNNTKTATKKVKIDTSNMIVILGGAYTDVYKNLLEKNSIGFGNNISEKPKYRKATTKDFIDYGMMTDEFMGRVTVIKLNDLDVNDIKRVMLESDESAMKVQEKIFGDLGIKLTFTDNFTTEVARQAEKKKTGARGLNGIIDEATWQAFAKVYEHPEKYSEVILDEETAKDSSHYQLVKKNKK